MTDYNDNQLVVKAQIEHGRAAAQDQQMATAGQPTAQQNAQDVAQEVTIGTHGSDSPTSTVLEPQTQGSYGP